MSKTIFLTQPFGRNYAIRHYLQTRGIAVNPHTESQVDYLISEYQARMPIIKDDLYIFLDRINIV